MREEIKRKFSQKDDLINRIIETEWMMFDQVNNAGGRAGCQDDEWTFYAMRYSLHNAFSMDTLSSYMQDLNEAAEEGRNLLTEKYAYMMEFTDPDYFDRHLREHLPRISPEKADLVDRVANLMIRCEKEFETAYPAFASAGRPLLGTGGGDVSFHVYTIGELKTYSQRTLLLYLQDLHQACERKENPSCVIHKMTAEFYGYNSLEEAEAKLRNKNQK
ncbi:DUF4125 family protein [Anaerovorax odorimutans]|uniref:DUF4125 family protein n=1 Tax=Anaerovorax odorimutans TaxID=109327 RepID=A0ABT1RJ08_9FIRM|nr:DUF4125 family protein [Anaerovorax odorimutans]MCQ4635149.1 DUF4125 family protein [Anaerovorax odorimutans]